MGAVGGKIYIKADGVQYKAKGSWSYLVNRFKKEGVVGADGVHGYKETPQVPYVEGEITDSYDLDLDTVQGLTDATITLELANGKVILLRNAWYASEGKVQTDEGNIECRFEGLSGEEVK